MSFVPGGPLHGRQRRGLPWPSRVAALSEIARLHRPALALSDKALDQMVALIWAGEIAICSASFLGSGETRSRLIAVEFRGQPLPDFQPPLAPGFGNS
jgi:hypothetical protein